MALEFPTYTLKPICPNLHISINSTDIIERYEKLEQPFIEKYLVWIDEGRFLGLYLSEEGDLNNSYYDKYVIQTE